MQDVQQLESLDHIPADNMEQIKAIAKMCHETNRAYLSAVRANVKPWNELEQQDKDSAIEQVAFLIINPESDVSEWHKSWTAKMIVAGWKYAAKRSVKSKTHECLKTFHHLPEQQQVKDSLFHAVVQQAIFEA